MQEGELSPGQAASSQSGAPQPGSPAPQEAPRKKSAIQWPIVIVGAFLLYGAVKGGGSGPTAGPNGEPPVGTSQEKGDLAITYDGLGRGNRRALPWKIRDMDRGSSAERAGLQVGDLVVAIDGRGDLDDSYLYAHKVGDTVVLTVERGGMRFELPTMLEVDKGTRPK